MFAIDRLRMENCMILIGEDLVSQFQEEHIDEDADDAQSCIDFVWDIQEKYEQFCLSWESGDNKCEVSRVLAILMKHLTRWHACKEGVKVGNYNLLGVEGCDWIEFWAAKAVGKFNYLLETKRCIEANNKREPWQREYKLLNQFFRMITGSNFMSNDDFCKKHNDVAKKCSREPNFEKMCDQSKHLQGAMRASLEYFWEGGRKRTTFLKMEGQIDTVYRYLKKLCVFECLDQTTVVDNNTFWNMVVPKKVCSSKRGNRAKVNEKVNETDHERVALEVFMNRPTIASISGAQEIGAASPTSERVSDFAEDTACVCEEESVDSAGGLVNKRADGGRNDVADIADDGSLGMDDMLCVPNSPGRGYRLTTYFHRCSARNIEKAWKYQEIPNESEV